MEERASQAASEAELTRIDRELGGPIETIVAEMRRLETRKAELTALLAGAGEPPPLLHPKMAEVWRERVAALREALKGEASKAEAFNVIRSLIDRVTLVPDGGTLAIELRGDLAAMLRFAANKKRSAAERTDLEAQVSLVAGARFDLYRTTVAVPFKNNSDALAGYLSV